MHSKWPNYLLLGFGGEGFFVWFVLNVFPWSSWKVFKYIPNSTTQVHPICFHESWTFTYIGGLNLKAPLCFYFGECPTFPKNWWWVIESGFLKKQLWVERLNAMILTLMSFETNSLHNLSHGLMFSWLNINWKM